MLDDIFIGSLVVTSIVAVAFIIERGLALRWAKVVPPEVEFAVDSFASQADLKRIQAVCEKNPSALSRLLLVILNHLGGPRPETISALETKARHEVARLDKWLVVLEIIVGIAPLLGLTGTVYGLVTLFGGLSKNALGDYSQLARGIGLALNATLMGLMIAIPTLIAWSYYSKKVETLAVEMESICDEFLRRASRKAAEARLESEKASAKAPETKSAPAKA
jgi:biopolymer transport protein ExbB